MDVRSAELTKYAANAMLATRISFMNELANLADALGADIEHVRQGIGSDPRIGCQFLFPGVGYGGSCFPKDVKALQHTATQLGLPLAILGAVEAANEAQKRGSSRRSSRGSARTSRAARFALWGLAFKPNTDDMREAPSREIIAGARGARRERRRLRSGGDAGGEAHLRRVPRLTYAASPMAARRGRGRARRRHRMEGVPQPRLRRDARRAAGSRWSSTAATCTSLRSCVRRDSNTSRSAAASAGAPPRTTAPRRLPRCYTARMTDANSRFSAWRERVARTRVLVVGDVMLDRYWFGDVERISPEAPVPVVKIARTEERPGGAANVARNAAALGARTTLLSVDRRRRGRRRARAPARGRPRADVASTATPTLPTTVKLRVIGRQQQLLRIDFETAPSHEVLATKLADYDRPARRERPRDPVRLRQGRPRAHRDDDRARARGRKAGAGRSRRATTGRGTAARR